MKNEDELAYRSKLAVAEHEVNGLRSFDTGELPAFLADDERPTLPKVGDAGDGGRRA